MAAAPAQPKTSRRKQIAQAFRIAKKKYPRIGWLLLGVFLLTGLVIGFAGWVWVHPVAGVSTGVMCGLLAAVVLFGRRVEKAAYAQVEGQPGAAAAALQMLRRGWKVDPVVAFTKQQDVVHRVVGPPGIVLVGEGSSPNRLKSLMITERRKHERVVADAPIHEVICGNGEGQVPLTKLVRHVTKLGRGVKPAEMTDILNRLKALDANRSNIPLPKGPMPTSMKGMRGNQRGR